MESVKNLLRGRGRAFSYDGNDKDKDLEQRSERGLPGMYPPTYGPSHGPPMMYPPAGTVIDDRYYPRRSRRGSIGHPVSFMGHGPGPMYGTHDPMCYPPPPPVMVDDCVPVDPCIPIQPPPRPMTPPMQHMPPAPPCVPIEPACVPIEPVIVEPQQMPPPPPRPVTPPIQQMPPEHFGATHSAHGFQTGSCREEGGLVSREMAMQTDYVTVPVQRPVITETYQRVHALPVEHIVEVTNIPKDNCGPPGSSMLTSTHFVPDQGPPMCPPGTLPVGPAGGNWRGGGSPFAPIITPTPMSPQVGTQGSIYSKDNFVQSDGMRGRRNSSGSLPSRHMSL